MDSILRSASQLNLLHSSSEGTQELSQYSLDQLKQQSELVQLCLLSALLTTYNEEEVLESCCSRLLQSMVTCDSGPHDWLGWRWGPQSQCRLSSEARDLIREMEAHGMLSHGSVPELAAEVLPGELQAAYVLCLAGYRGDLPLEDFAIDVLRYFVSLVSAKAKSDASLEPNSHPAQGSIELVMNTALKSSELASQVLPNSPIRVRSWYQLLVLTQPHINNHIPEAEKQAPVLGDIARVLAVLMAMGKISLVSVPLHALKTLLAVSPAAQLWCLCQLSIQVLNDVNPAAFLAWQCKKYEAQRKGRPCSQYAQARMQTERIQLQVSHEAQTLLNEAYQSGFLKSSEDQDPLEVTIGKVIFLTSTAYTLTA